MQILLAMAVAAVAAASPSSDLKRSEPVLVRAVVDGDTIDVARYGRVRLLGIDAPEVGHGLDTPAPFGKESRERLIALVLGRWVRLEQDGVALDVYNRHLAYVVREDGVFVNAALVRDGLARVSARTPLVRLPELKRAEADAQSSRRGMWGATPQIPATSYTARSEHPKTRTVRPRKPRATPAKPKTTAKPKAKTKHPRGSDPS